MEMTPDVFHLGRSAYQHPASVCVCVDVSQRLTRAVCNEETWQIFSSYVTSQYNPWKKSVVERRWSLEEIKEILFKQTF